MTFREAVRLHRSRRWIHLGVVGAVSGAQAPEAVDPALLSRRGRFKAGGIRTRR